ncbi:MAG: quinone-dependent dihydroorotate dehydrogenase [Patescibacteria group bacterium]
MFLPSLANWTYQKVAKPLFFRVDPEVIHDRFTMIGRILGRIGFARAIISGLFKYTNPILEQEILGIKFPNPVGLSAGFDKDALMVDIMPSVGFGFEEIGSVTGEKCNGNVKPRLWRLPKSKGLIVNYGLKNDGCEVISRRLKNKKFNIPMATSIAKTNSFETADEDMGISDYAKALEAFTDVGDLFIVNVSCPNAFGGEPFTTPEKLNRLLATLDRFETKKPVFVKLPVDISNQDLDDLVTVMDHHRVDGVVLSNLTKNRDRQTIDQEEVSQKGQGGISGRPTFEPSNELISHMYKKYGDRYVIIGVGGIFSAQDAYEKIKRGASLVQLITGMIYNGPQLIGQINQGLVELLKKDGYSNISEAIGANHRQ